MQNNYDWLSGQFPVPSGLEQKTAEGIAQAFSKVQLTMEKTSRALWGTKRIAQQSKVGYEKNYRGFFSFLCEIGDYDSLMVLHKNRHPDKTPSMNADSVALYMLYKTGEEGADLCRMDSDDAVLDVNGDIITCSGEWNCMVSVEQFLTSISAAHRGISQSGCYRNSCPDCFADVDKPTANGCHNHRGRPLFWRTGNPRDSEVVKNAHRECSERLVNHKVKSCLQILPAEFQKIRKHLLSSNSLDDLQHYCMSIVSIHLFLRCDDLTKMEMGHYVPHLSSFNSDDTPNSLCIKVKGKTDKTWKYLLLFRIDSHPTLCPVRHLLLYLALRRGCGVTDNSPFIFPDYSQGGKKFCYQKFLRIVKEKFSRLVGRNEKITSHVFRKTGYLFAVWGLGIFVLIKAAARHATDAVALRYFQDAKTLYEVLISNSTVYNPDNDVPTWRSNYIVNTEANQQLVNSSTASFSNLVEVAEHFLQKMGISFPLSKTNITQYIDILHAECEVCDETRFRSVIEPLPGAQQREAIHLFTGVKTKLSAAEEELNEIKKGSVQVSTTSQCESTPNKKGPVSEGSVEVNSTSHGESTPNSISRRSKSSPSPSNNNNSTVLYKRKVGGNDLTLRHSLKYEKDMGNKLRKVLALHDKAVENTTSLTENARSYYNNVLKPIRRCFVNHCESDSSQFLQKWDIGSAYTKFGRQKCHGRGKCGEHY